MARNSRPTSAEPHRRMLVALAVGLTLLASTLFIAVPPAAHATITGTPSLGTVDSATAPSSFAGANSSLDVIAGTEIVTVIDGSPASQPSLFAISFTGVTFAAPSIYLYMSMDGNAEISNAQGDVFYGGPFPAAALGAPTASGYTATGALSHDGPYFVGGNVITGPVATLINSSFRYLKVYDGSCGAPTGAVTFSCSGTGIAGAKQAVVPVPGISFSPASGPAGTAVTLEGGGFAAGATVDIEARYSTAPWVGSNSTKTAFWSKDVATDTGFFKVTAPMVDTKQVINPSTTGPFTTVPVVLSVVSASNTATVLNSAQESLAPPTFKEFSRGIASVLSYDSSGSPVDVTDGAFALNHLYGNDSGSTGTVGSVTVRDLTPVNAEVFGTLKVAGNFSDVGQPVTFWVETTPGTFEQMNTTAPVIPDSVGSWKATVEIPVLSGGAHTILVVNDGVDYGLSNSAGGTITTTTTTTTSTTTTRTTVNSTATSSTVTSATSASTSSTTTTSSATTTTGSPTTSSTTSPSGSSSSSTTSGGVPVFPYDGAALAAMVLVVFAGYLIARSRMKATGRYPGTGPRD